MERAVLPGKPFKHRDFVSIVPQTRNAREPSDALSIRKQIARSLRAGPLVAASKRRFTETGCCEANTGIRTLARSMVFCLLIPRARLPGRITSDITCRSTRISRRLGLPTSSIGAVRSSRDIDLSPYSPDKAPASSGAFFAVRKSISLVAARRAMSACSNLQSRLISVCWFRSERIHTRHSISVGGERHSVYISARLPLKHVHAAVTG